LLRQALRRHAVRLRQQDIERHRRAGAGQAIDDAGEGFPGPGPLPDPLEALLVDGEDAHRRLRVIGAGQDALIDVEDLVAQLGDQRPVLDPPSEGGHQDQEGDQPIEIAAHAARSLE
jgi:hypothetical protein